MDENTTMASTMMGMAEDCIDPDCGLITNREFDNEFTTGWQLYVQASNAATLTQDKTNQLSGVNSAKVNVTTTQNGTGGTCSWLRQANTCCRNKIHYFYSQSFHSKSSFFWIAAGCFSIHSYYYQNINLYHYCYIFSYLIILLQLPTQVCNIVVQPCKATGNIWIDNVQIKNR